MGRPLAAAVLLAAPAAVVPAGARAAAAPRELTTAAPYFPRYRLCVQPPGSGAAGRERCGSFPGVHRVTWSLRRQALGPTLRFRLPLRQLVRAVCQRVERAGVRVDGRVRGRIERGLCVLLGVARGDGEDEAVRLAGKVARLRVFADEDGRFDRSLLDVGGAALVVSQFTLLADTAKGNRPSFTDAARPEQAEALYERFCDELRHLGVPVETGVFGARMELELVNDGPVTIILDA